MPPILRCLAVVLVWSPGGLAAGSAALFAADSFPAARGALTDGGTAPVRATRASLFVGTEGRSLFAPPAASAAQGIPTLPALRGTAIAQIRHLIGQAESRKHGYDAVQHGARIRPAKRPTDMTVAEILQWVRDTPGQPHAIGRYQFIPATLRSLVKRTGTPLTARFTPQLQDRLSDVLLADAGLHRFRAGEITRTAFMNNLAKIWAGLPDSSGKSYYHGYAGNRASITWAQFDAEMARIFPG
ncbi:hypothetical protein ACOXXX_11025 [Thalassococcus sp. BH17M4-6]|uniref:hypothetical protein n=1 Tax=Thalassococcus sp. BH17M4-6 TaxID=3413148 RepID=UPI003BDEACE0